MSWLKKYDTEGSNVQMAYGGMIKRADGSYSKRGLWDNIRANKGSGKKPTKEMLEQERKIKAQEKQDGGPINPIYVTDKNDPRLRAYNDSLSLHRQYYTDLDALRAELAEDDRTINRIGSLPFNRYSYQSNYASDPIKPESIVGFRSPEIDYTWQIPYYRKPVQPVVYRKPATVSPTGTVRSVPVETVAPVLPKRETLLPISTDVVPMQTAGSYSEPTLMPDNLPRVAYKASEPQASKLYPYSAAANLAAMNKPVGYGKDTDGKEIEFSAEEWDKLKGTNYRQYNKPEKKEYGGWLNQYDEGGPIEPEPPIFGGTLRPVEVTPYTQNYPQYSNLTPQERKLFSDKGPIGRSIQSKAKYGSTYDVNNLKDVVLNSVTFPIAGGLQGLQIPQALMIEGIEHARGNPYNYSNVMPRGFIYNKQRAPSDTFLKGTGLVPELVGDILIDPLNVFGAGYIKNFFKNPTGSTGKHVLKMFGKEVKEIPENVATGIKASKQVDNVHDVFSSRLYNENQTLPQNIASSVDDVGKGLTQAPKPAWQLEELPGLHLKSTMENNPQGLHKYVAKDGSIDTKSALEHIKRMEGDVKYEAVLENMQNKYGISLENLPKRIDYNTLRKDVQEGLWDIGTGKGQGVDMYAGKDMKSHGLFPKKNPTSLESILSDTKGLGYEEGEIALDSYSFTNKNKFIGGSNAHNMPEETLGHVRSFTNPKEPGVYYSAERQSNWAQEMSTTTDPLLGGKVKRKDIHERLLKNEKSLKESIKEQEDLIANGNDTWAVSQKERLEGQLKRVQETIAQNNKYINASPQEKLVMKNINERMLQEDVAHAASQGHNKYRLPSEESVAKIQGFKATLSRESGISTAKSELEIVANPEAYKKKRGINKENPGKHFEKTLKEYKENPELFIKTRNDKIEELEKGLKKYGDLYYSKDQQTILNHTSQSLKDAEKLFGVKLKPVKDSKGNTWYEFDIPDKFKKGKGEIKAFSLLPYVIPTGLGIGAASQIEQKQMGGWLNKYN